MSASEYGVAFTLLLGQAIHRNPSSLPSSLGTPPCAYALVPLPRSSHHTAQEAYNRTHRILNITVNSRDQLEAPRLLNYITSPNVVIWTAACASCALSYLFDPVEVRPVLSAVRVCVRANVCA